MSALSIITEKLNSANIAVKSDGMADYEIKANINVYGNEVNNIDGGQVVRRSDNTTVATFNSWGGMEGGFNMTVTYLVGDVALQCEINQRVNEFVAKVKENPAGFIN